MRMIRYGVCLMGLWSGVVLAGDPVLAPCPASPNCVSSQAAADDARHRIEPFVLAVPASEAWPKIRAAVAATVRTEIVGERHGYLHAEVTSRIFRFVDDLELLLDAGSGQVQVRSASRVGYGDMGVNRKRVETLRALLQQQGVIAP